MTSSLVVSVLPEIWLSLLFGLLLVLDLAWKEERSTLLGAVAVTGAQFAFLVTGLVIIETIFAWPGIGWLLVQSTTNLDFPVVQAITFFVVLAVFLINTLTDAVQRLIDPRLRAAAEGPGR